MSTVNYNKLSYIKYADNTKIVCIEEGNQQKQYILNIQRDDNIFDKYSSTSNIGCIKIDDILYHNMYLTDKVFYKSALPNRPKSIQDGTTNDYSNIFSRTINNCLTSITKVDNTIYSCLQISPYGHIDISVDSYAYISADTGHNNKPPDSQISTCLYNKDNINKLVNSYKTNTQFDKNSIIEKNITGIEYNMFLEIPGNILNDFNSGNIAANSIIGKNQYNSLYTMSHTENIYDLLNCREYIGIDTCNNQLFLKYYDNINYKLQNGSNSTHLSAQKQESKTSIFNTKIQNIEVISNINRYKNLNARKTNLYSLKIDIDGLNSDVLTAQDKNLLKTNIKTNIRKIIKTLTPAQTQLFNIFINNTNNIKDKTIYVNIPSITTVYTYTGNEQYINLNENLKYKISGDISATNVGEYIFTLTLSDNKYYWSDDTIESKSYKWFIIQAENKWNEIPRLENEQWTISENDKFKIIEGSPKFGEVKIELDGEEYNINDVFTNTLGKHEIKFIVEENENYKGLIQTYEFTITLNTNMWNIEPQLIEELSWRENEQPENIILDMGSPKFGNVKIELNGKTYDNIDEVEFPTDPGTYNIKFIVEETNEYTGLIKTFSFNIIGLIRVEIPSQLSYTYTGDEQTVEISSNDKYTVVNNIDELTKTDAGEYTVTLKLNEGYVWSDGSFDDKTIEWSITQATNAWTTEPKLSETEWEQYETTVILTNGIDMFGNNAIMKLGDETITELPTEPGNYTIEFIVEEDDNYTRLSTTLNFTIKQGDEKKMPLTFSLANDDENNFGTIQLENVNQFQKKLHLEYSLDNGQTWINNDEVSDDKNIIKSPIRISGKQKLLLRANDEGNSSINFGGVFDGKDEDLQYYVFRLNSSKFNVDGNIQTLLKKDGSENRCISYCFRALFHHCTNMVMGPRLLATHVGTKCYYEMFEYCENLLSLNSMLPASTLTQECYYHMFKGCLKLNALSVNFTRWSDDNTKDWLLGTAPESQGLEDTLYQFYCPKDLSSELNTRNESTIPEGWTIYCYNS